MIRLALLSTAYHRGSIVTTGLVALVGVALLSAMAGVMATGLDPATPASDRPFLVQFPAILGSWMLAIVLFAVVSTVGVGLTGRVDEIRGLRLIGATPGQVQRMIAAEAFAVSVVAAVPGVLLGYLLGAGIVSMTVSTGVVTGDGGYAPGLLFPLLAGVVVACAAAVGAMVGSRAGARRSPVGELTAGRVARSARPRRIAAAVLVVVGLASSSSSLMMEPGSVYATAATGPGCVLVAVGLALFAPELLRLADLTVVRIAQRTGGPAGRLAAINLRAAPERIRPAVTFLTLFVGVAAGTLSMQAIENRASGATIDGTAQLMATINYLVVVLIAAFMSIALVNNLIASIGQRRGELSVLSSIGATTTHAISMLVRETAVAAALAIVVGGLGAVVAVVPFAILKSGSALAAWQPGPIVATMIFAATIALATTVVAGRRTATTAMTH